MTYDVDISVDTLLVSLPLASETSVFVLQV